MTAAILVISTERYSGKSSLAVAMSMEFMDRGYSVGYMKPVGFYPMKVEKERVDEDAYFISKTLGLDVRLSDLSPYFLNWDTMNRYMRKRPAKPEEKVLKAYGRLAQGKDVMILEGGQNLVHGEILGLSAAEIADLLDAKVLLLETFKDDLIVDRILATSKYFGERLLGIVVNWVPEHRLSFARNLLPRFLEERNIELIGSVPTDRVLRSISVSDLASGLNGEIICAKDKGEELVESMMVGAMGQEQALRLFRKQANKVVITGGDRTDIQLAALETPTKCLVLTGGHRPSRLVLGQAEELGVPMILVDYDTATTVEMVDSTVGHQKVHNPEKINRMRKFVEEELNLDLLLEGIDLPPEKR